MSSYPNYHNSYRYPNEQQQQQQQQQPAQQPPQGYMEATYPWNNQNPNRSYSHTNDAYSRTQDPSSSFTHLPAALGSYSQSTRTENTQRSTGLNSLVYASSLQSDYIKNSGASQSNVGGQGSSNSHTQNQTATASYNYPSQNPVPTSAAKSQVTTNYNQQTQQAASAVSRTSATPYTYQNTSVNNDAIRHYHTQPTHMSQPERRPSPNVNQRGQQSRKTANYKSPPVTHSSTNAMVNAPSQLQTPHGYSSYSANTSSVVNPSHTATASETSSTVTQDYPQVTEARTTNQTSPSKVQYINPSDLYTQQYFLAQERARAAEAEEMAAEEARKKEAEARAQAEAVARAVEAEAATASTQATPTSTTKGKSAKSNAAKNTSKKRSSAKKKAPEKAAAPADLPAAEGDDDMAVEMRMMLEKLRGMRTKDPSLFAKLWDDFKKPPASTQTASTPEPPAPAPNQSTSKPSSSTRTPNKLDKDGLPDLGRFPAQRRRRQKKSDAAEVIATNSQLDTSEPVAQVNINSMLNQQHQQSPAPVANQPVARTQQDVSNTAPSTYKAKAAPAKEATWPAATKQKLANAASEYLSKDAANKGKQCSPESLMLLLRIDPTYEDLCAQLESRGFTLDRQRMARFLLAAVPELVSGNNGQEQKKTQANKNTPPSNASPSLPPSTTQPPQPAQPPPPQPSQSFQQPQPPQDAVPPLPQGVPTSDLDIIYYQPGARTSQPGASKTFDPSSETAGPSNQKKEKRSWQRPRRSDGAWMSNTPIGPKAEMAKKRLFSEIVDMSQLSSDDEEMHSDEEDEDGFSRSNTNMNLNDAQQPSFPDPGLDAMNVDSDSPHPAEQSVSDSHAEMADPEIEFDPDDEFVLREIKRLPNIAKPLNRAAALKRVYYNPKSIARDVMLATGRHPSERPLNFHLMHLTQTFVGFTLRSDLETFRWDLVDPGGPSMPVVELEDILVEPPQLTRKKRRRHDTSRDDADAKGPTSDGRPQPSQTLATPGQQLLPSISTPHGARDSMAGTPTTGQRTGRRGRPPGAKNKNPTKAALKAAAQAQAVTGTSTRNVQSAVPAPASSVPEPSYPMFTCEWGSCPAQLHDVHTLERHVVKNHISGQTTCQWQNCPNHATEYSGEGLREHLAKAHIQPLAWKYGDGPSVNGTDFNLDRYLNANGLIVTPDATTAGESDALIFPVEPIPIRAFNKLYGDQKPTDRARQVLRAVQKRRKRVGIGLEQEGCEFSTPVRNKLFVNDENFYEVVADDEEGTDDWFSQGHA